jgi:glycosyltransferase involved in cell wall biosynthesis
MTTTIVIPCYNEEKRLNIQAFSDFAIKNLSITFLFINDGSKDNTVDLLTQLTNNRENLQFLNLEKNGGKAEAVRRGMLFAAEKYDCDFIGFFDADLATPLVEIKNFISTMAQNDFDLITGLRLMRLGAKVKRKTSRHYLGRIFATSASKMLKLPVYDTQCGAKLYKKQVVEPLFKDNFITKWLFDVEILARYINIFGREKAMEKIYEYPLYQWEDIGGSQLKVRDFFKAPVELWKIKRRYL